MLFRAQVPLLNTSLVSFDDERLISIFECHHPDHQCQTALGWVHEPAAPTAAPKATTFDVVLKTMGAAPSQVLAAFEDDPGVLSEGTSLPAVVVAGASQEMAQQACSLIIAAGGDAWTRPNPPRTLLEMHGGQVMPYEEEAPGARRTTLPPLGELKSEAGAQTMRGLFGGATPGYRDHGETCGCGRPMRTAVRLMGAPTPDNGGIRLDPAYVQVCTRCGLASVHRMNAKQLLALG